jgi:glutathione S-transferase
MRALWALAEMGLDYELETLPFPPRIFARSFKEVNPLGTVPAFIDGATMLTESAGICHYLAEKYGPTPLAVAPAEPDYGAYVNWIFRSDATLTFPQTIVLRYTAMETEERRLPQAAADYRAWFLARWRSVERGLAGRDYLCADRFTMADICVGFAFHLSQILGIEEAASPNVAAWWARISTRPAFLVAAA